MGQTQQPERIEGQALALRDPLPWETFTGLVRDAEGLGYRALFLPEIGERDAFVTLGALAGETRDLLLATGVAPMTSRAPGATATAAATVQERSRGRMILGLGTGRPAPGSLATLEEQVEKIRALLDRPREGDGHLPLPAPVPIWLAALGPRALRLAGTVADGVLLNWCTPEQLVRSRDAVRAAATEAGRDPEAITIAVYVRACTIDDREEALAAARVATAGYAALPAYARQLAAMGLASQGEAAAAALRDGRPEDVPAELVEALVALGDPGSARDRIATYRASGADLVVVYPVAAGPDQAGSIRRTLTDLAPAPS